MYFMNKGIYRKLKRNCGCLPAAPGLAILTACLDPHGPPQHLLILPSPPRLLQALGFLLFKPAKIILTSGPLHVLCACLEHVSVCSLHGEGEGGPPSSFGTQLKCLSSEGPSSPPPADKFCTTNPHIHPLLSQQPPPSPCYSHPITLGCLLGRTNSMTCGYFNSFVWLLSPPPSHKIHKGKATYNWPGHCGKNHQFCQDSGPGTVLSSVLVLCPFYR